MQLKYNRQPRLGSSIKILLKLIFVLVIFILAIFLIEKLIFLVQKNLILITNDAKKL